MVGAVEKIQTKQQAHLNQLRRFRRQKHENGIWKRGKNQSLRCLSSDGFWCGVQDIIGHRVNAQRRGPLSPIKV